MSFSSFVQNQKKRFKNFPLNASNNPVSLSLFTMTMEEELVAWRDHFIASFRERGEDEQPYDRAFRFLTLQGREPSLTMITMGKGKERVSVSGPIPYRPLSPIPRLWL
jgi:hypothetical protein